MNDYYNDPKYKEFQDIIKQEEQKMRATEFLNYINKKNKLSKKETDENYSHLTCNEYEEVLKDGKIVKRLTKQSQKYEEIRKEITKDK